MARQFHRPARLDPEAAEQIEGSTDTAVASELAHRAAQALIGGFPGTETEDDPITRSGIVAAVATNGIDDIAELWADSPATTLPGTLWRLFLVREWIRRDPELVARRYATVIDLTEADDATNARLESALGALPDRPARASRRRPGRQRRGLRYRDRPAAERHRRIPARPGGRLQPRVDRGRHRRTRRPRHPPRLRPPGHRRRAHRRRPPRFRRTPRLRGPCAGAIRARDVQIGYKGPK